MLSLLLEGVYFANVGLNLPIEEGLAGENNELIDYLLQAQQAEAHQGAPWQGAGSQVLL